MKKQILDNQKEIRRLDRNSMISHCIEAPEYCRRAVELTQKIEVDWRRPKMLIVAGVGGSAIGGELLKDWVGVNVTIPIEVCRGYKLPSYADEKTLIIVTSYSGETEEALSMFLDAVRKGCMIFCISSGGSLLDFAGKLKITCLKVPPGIPPRAALPYLFLPLPLILEKAGLIANVGAEIPEVIKALETVKDENSPDRPFSRNYSKQLAYSIDGTIPVIYGYGIYRAVALRYKQQFNENSKVPSKWEFFPELNHNEIVGWEGPHKFAQQFSVLLLRDEDEPLEIRRRIEATKDLISQDLKIYEVWSPPPLRRLAKMLYTTYVGDFASVYLAVLRGADPTPVRSIRLLKERIAAEGIRQRIINELRKLVE